MKGKALGKGLSALIPGADERSEYLEIPISAVKENPFQPRLDMDLQALKELADSIRENGLIQPIAVCRNGDEYRLISGARRLKAAQIAGLNLIQAVVLEVESEAQLLELALVENLQREDLNPLELANGYKRLIDECGLTQEEVAKKVGKERPTITNTLRLLKLPDFIKEALRRNEISAGHAKALAGVEDNDKAVDLCRRIIKEGLNVRQLERLITNLEHTSRKKIAAGKSSYIMEVENRLRKLYGTKINITTRRKGGVIEISYFSQVELERLLEVLETVAEGE
jgi:ParB family chromosome partitioning protein